ncbi:MAG: gliding motility-associated C-terminal domain-containing protein [Flavobacteriia bacterium]|nr:gliding motility-associated C-terminal domain-containing protein [Flavobacteriia bacterium]
MKSLYSLPCKRRVWLLALTLVHLMAFGQIGWIYDPSSGTILDPNSDGWISASGGAIDTSVVIDESFDFEYPMIPMFHLSAEPPADLQGGNDCGKSEIVDNPGYPMSAGYWYLGDPDAMPGNGDEFLMYRIRIARNVTGAYGFSFLIDTDNKMGFTGAGADPNAVAGNPGFELEVIYGTNAGGLVSIMDVDGTTTGTTLSSYPGASHSQRSYAGYTNCPLSDPIFIDFYIPYDSLGVSPTDSIRMIFATATSPNSALGGSASDIGGVNDNLFSDGDSIFVAITDSTPSFTFGGCGWAIAQQGAQVSCHGDTDGWAWVDVWGGSPPVTYLWSTGATNDTVYNLSAGTYEIYVTSGGGCTDTVQVTVTEPDSLIANVDILDSILCYGDLNGRLGGFATGGTPPYTTSWSNGALQDTLSNIGAGTYTYYVTDANGCSDSIVVNLTQPSSPIAVAIQNQNEILCFGDSIGSLDILITGGTPPYTVLWDDGNTDSLRNNLVAGTYSVVVTDANGCSDSLTTVLSQPAQPVGGLTLLESPVSCFGGADGVGVVVATGGRSPYTFLWSNGETNDTAVGLSAGSHTVIITDSVGCTDTLALVMTQPDSALTLNINMDAPVSCFGGNDGEASVAVSGGTLPYSYLWNTGDTTNSIVGPAGTYSVVVTDANGCLDSASITITQPTAALVVAITDSSDVLCFGDANGSATANASGGTPPYDFEWSNGVIDTVVTGLSGGTYTVVVTDALGCQDSASVTIAEPTAELIASATILQEILCNGDSDGSGYVDITGGTSPYSISWSNGATTDTISSLVAGTYTATITDANGCQDTAVFTLTEPTALNISGIVDANVLCFGDSTGEATITVTGGTSPYTYVWSSGQTTANPTDLTAGTHTVVVTDANGCQDSVDITITQPASGLIAGTSSTVGVTCRGDVNGSATASASGGTPPYTYSWSNGMTGQNISGLAGGDYILTVTDANGCTDTSLVNIFEPAFELLVGAADGTTITCNGANDGTAYASASGGVPPYTYAWSNGMTGDTITGISAGSYIVTVTDSMGCTDTNTVVVTEPDPLLLNVTGTMITCFGLSDGSASSAPSGGEAPYTYLWNTGATTSSVSMLAPGNYWVTVTDNRGCVQTDSIEITTPSMPLAAIITKTDVNCFGGTDGTATANGSGGVSPYDYLWSDGQTGQTATGLAPGNYHVIMTDANGCQDSAFVTINEPASALSSNVTLLTTPTCGVSNGSGYVTVTGGTPPYTYVWADGTANDTITGLGGGLVAVTITDSNGCVLMDTLNVPPPAADLDVVATVIGDISCYSGADGILYGTATGGTAPYTISWSTGDTGDTLTGVSAGTYTVFVVDSNGCTSSSTVTVGEPDSIVTTTTVIANVSCFGGSDGSATAAGSGGTGAFTYLWADGQTTATATGLTAGTHTVTITDANGCSEIDSVTITQPATPVDVSAVMDVAVSCFSGSDGSATATGSGGTAPYTFLWANGQTTATATGLSAGSHLVTVTDSLGCTDTVSVIITEPASAVDVTISQVWAVSCVGDADGWASVSGSGGTSPYTYAWSNGQTGDSATGLAAGSYVVTVTDANGCQDTVNVTVTEPATPLSASAIDALTISCFGGSDGTAYATASGGWAPYTFSWNTGSSNDTITGLAVGTYTVTITDSLGCQTTADVTLTQPTQVAATATRLTNVSCLGGSDGSAFANGSGGTPPYTYSWSNGELNDTAFALSAGTHTVTITDSNGCTATATITITQPATAVNATASVLSQVLCLGDSTATARASASGGTSPYSYLWNNGQTTRTATGLWAGTHTVVVTDANGCVDSATVTITQPATAVDASAIMTAPVSCFGGNDGTASASATGGTPPYTFTWSNGVTGANTTTLSSQWYVVTATDANGCTDTARVFITQPTAPVTAGGTVVANVTCFGGADGIAWANATGGTAPYTYTWSDGQTGDTATGLVAGNYAVLVTDSMGCQDLVSVTITEPATDIMASATAYATTSCYGGADGEAYVTVTNGVAPFTYLWSDGQTTDTATGLAAGNHTVVVTDALGCEATTNVTIQSPPQDIILTPTVISDVSCLGGADGSANVFAQGGTSPYSYLWSDGQTTATASNLAAGLHSVVVTDAQGCMDTTQVTITEPASSVDASASVLFPVNCFGGSDGYATATATGGTPPYSYTWNDGQTGYTASGLDTGLYIVTVTDANGCTDTAHVTMTQPDSAVTVSIDVLNNVRCLGGSDGSALASATGGTPPYSFDWDHGTSVALASGLPAGTYTVTVTDDNGCQDSISVVITQPSSVLNLTAVEFSAVNCFGGSDGVAIATATGGDGPYTYAWSNGATGDTATGLTAGSYTVMVTDSNGCQVTVGVTITQPASALSATATINSNVLCFGTSTGSATASATGGTAPYTYAWNDGQTTANATALAAGTYTVTVTDANGCIDTASVTITQPSSSVGSLASIINNVSCFGGNDGQASVVYTGGTAPYVVSWSNGAGTDTITGLAAGMYTVTITDANGCIREDSVIITEPASAISASASVVSNVDCFGSATGSANATATGGTAPYTYSWSNGATTDTISSLIAGTYSVIVTDANGCTDTASVTITQPASALAVSLLSSQNVDCFGNASGSAEIDIVGGTAPYSISWNNGVTTALNANIVAGTYSVTVTDANGCTDTLSVSITQPAAALTSTSTVLSQVSCFGGNNGQAFISYTGGTAPYSVSWSNGSTNDTISNLTAGTYTVTITDANGCTSNESVTITEPSSAVTASASVLSNVDCFGSSTGSAQASATGGVSPYTYSWSNGATTANITGLVAGTYSVTVTDANGCTDTSSVTITQPASALAVTLLSSQDVDCFGNTTGSAEIDIVGGTSPYSISWSHGATTAIINNLAAGSYTATVTDANGCTETITVVIAQPASALASSSTVISNVNCFGGNNGQAYVSYSGGTAPYSVSWSNGSGNDTISNLTAGSYTATITDANGCTTSESVTIAQPSSVIGISTSINNHVSCFGGSNGSATATGSGGTPPYSFSWSDGTTGATLNNATAGTYTVTVVDVNGCSANVNVVITEPASALSAAILSSSNVTCNGAANGTASVGASGGTAPYTYLWSNGATTANISNVGGGTYTVTVTDANGCTETASVTITEPAVALTSAVTILSQVDCFGGATGEAFVTYSGGTAPYSVNWITGQSTDTISNLTAGTYSVTIVDANGCMTSQTVVITQPASGLTVSATINNNVNCFGGTDGSATANVTGGTQPYSYSWSNGASTANLSNVTAGSYTVTVTDANGCIATASVNITQPAAPLAASAGVLSHVDCWGAFTGSASASATGGTGPYSYSWNTGATSSVLNNVAAGTYTVTITDANGCTDQASVIISQPASSIVFGNITHNHITCFGESDGSILINPSGGTPPYTYAWSNGATTQNLTNVPAGTYTVTVTDDAGCTATHTAPLNQPGDIVITKTGRGNVMCNGGMDGFASISVSGGVGPYSVSWNSGAAGNSISGLVAGQYIATVTDANGCSDTAVFNITQPAASLNASVGFIQNVSCYDGNDGVAYVAIAGGTQPYNISWSNGSSNDTISSLSAGSYVAIVTDANGCIDSTTVLITQPATDISANLTVLQHIMCKGDASGIISSQVTGGTPPYQLSWSNGSAADTIRGLFAGLYTLTVTDANGCVGTFDATVSEPTAGLNAAAGMLNPVRCFGEADGAARVLVTGGAAPYTVLWSDGSTADTIYNLPVGRYGVEIYDANGCYKTDSVDIIGPNEDLGVNANVVMVNCGGTNSGEIDVTPFGGTPPYSVNWNHGQSGQHITSLPVGVYPYTVVDGNGCIIQDTIEVVENEPIETDIYVEFASCPNSADGYVELNSQGGTPPYYYYFDGEPFTGIADDITPGSHEVTISDALGCDSTFYIYMGVDQEGDYLHIPNAFTPNEDRINEKYAIFGSECIGPSRFQIFDRWGNLVFSSHEPFKEFWNGRRDDGSLCKEDVYVWEFVSDNIEKRGHVVVIH